MEAALKEQAKPALPDFSNPAIAARAWADQFEARLLAQRQADERAVLLGQQKPCVSRAVAGEMSLWDVHQERESHLAHLRCCAAFLIEFQKVGMGTDDRYKRPAA